MYGKCICCSNIGFRLSHHYLENNENKNVLSVNEEAIIIYLYMQKNIPSIFEMGTNVVFVLKERE